MKWRATLLICTILVCSTVSFRTTAATPTADCRDVARVDRAIAACTTLNATKTLSKRTRSVALSNRCAAYQAKGMLQKALRDCSRAIKYDATNLDAYYNRGRARRLNGDVAGALQDYTEAVRLTGRSVRAKAKAFNNRGDAFAEIGNIERALADFESAIRIDPQYGKAFLNRGAMRSRRGELDAAITDYTEAYRLDSSLSRALVARGNAEMKRSRFDQALTDYGEALLLDPDHIETRLKVEQIRAINRTGTKPSSFELSGERAQSD